MTVTPGAMQDDDPQRRHAAAVSSDADAGRQRMAPSLLGSA